MNEQGIFLAAVDIDDAAARRQYLDDACRERPELRRAVEALLVAHEREGSFMDAPALQQLADGVAQTVDSAHDPSAGSDEGAGEIDLSFLEPSTTPGMLGRLGHYEIAAVVGRGGCGIVLKAFDEKLQRTVAIKAMAPELAATSPARKRFLREARAAAGVRHENVVSIHAVEERPIPYLVMEYVAGRSLQEQIDRTGPLELADVLHIGRQIADGLHAAHAQGIVHRDVKPANILLEGDHGRVTLTDFGLTRTADDASLTQSGAVAGTPLYMSPEQALGETVDARSDLFSLGSVLYAMHTGRPPFRAPNVLAVLQRVAHDDPRPMNEIIPETPDWFAALVGRLHAKNRDDRFATAKDVGDLLARCRTEWQRAGAVQLPFATAEPTAAPKPKARRGWAFAAGAALIALAGLAVAEAARVTNWIGTARRLFAADSASSIDKKAAEPTRKSLSRRPQFRSGGAWRLDGTELVQEKPEVSRLFFGDPAWTDYDFEVEGMSLGKADTHGLILAFRAVDLGNYLDLEVGGWSASVTEAIFFKAGVWGRSPGCFQKIPHRHGQWYRIKIEVRGTRVGVWIDGQNVFAYNDGDLLKGMVGLGSGNSPVRWRKLKVTAPDGRVLWEGFPELGEPPGAQPKTPATAIPDRP